MQSPDQSEAYSEALILSFQHSFMLCIVSVLIPGNYYTFLLVIFFVFYCKCMKTCVCAKLVLGHKGAEMIKRLPLSELRKVLRGRFCVWVPRSDG